MIGLDVETRRRLAGTILLVTAPFKENEDTIDIRDCNGNFITNLSVTSRYDRHDCQLMISISYHDDYKNEDIELAYFPQCCTIHAINDWYVNTIMEKLAKLAEERGE